MRFRALEFDYKADAEWSELSAPLTTIVLPCIDDDICPSKVIVEDCSDTEESCCETYGRDDEIMAYLQSESTTATRLLTNEPWSESLRIYRPVPMYPPSPCPYPPLSTRHAVLLLRLPMQLRGFFGPPLSYSPTSGMSLVLSSSSSIPIMAIQLAWIVAIASNLRARDTVRDPPSDKTRPTEAQGILEYEDHPVPVVSLKNRLQFSRSPKVAPTGDMRAPEEPQDEEEKITRDERKRLKREKKQAKREAKRQRKLEKQKQANKKISQEASLFDTWTGVDEELSKARISHKRRASASRESLADAKPHAPLKQPKVSRSSIPLQENNGHQSQPTKGLPLARLNSMQFNRQPETSQTGPPKPGVANRASSGMNDGGGVVARSQQLGPMEPRTTPLVSGSHSPRGSPKPLPNALLLLQQWQTERNTKPPSIEESVTGPSSAVQLHESSGLFPREPVGMTPVPTQLAGGPLVTTLSSGPATVDLSHLGSAKKLHHQAVSTTSKVKDVPLQTVPDSLCDQLSTELEPVQVLCSEEFLENWGDVVVMLATGRWARSFVPPNQEDTLPELQEETKGRSISCIDTSLVDLLGVDIELPCRGAVLVFKTSQLENEEEARAIVLKIAGIPAVNRYRVLYIFLCYDAQLSPQLLANLARLQSPFMQHGSDSSTALIFKTTTPESLGSSIAETVLNTTFDEETEKLVQASMQNDMLYGQILFLLTALPTLSLRGACKLLQMESFFSLTTNARARQKVMLLASSTPPKESEVSSHSMVQLTHFLRAQTGSNNGVTIQ